MDSLDRPRTSPHHSRALDNGQLPSPPLTGGFPKRLHFFEQAPQGTIGVHGMPLAAPFDSGLQSPVVEPCSCDGNHEAHDAAGQVSATPQAHQVDQHGTFHFMALPLEIRNRIYRLLLAVLGVIVVRQNRTPGSTENGSYIGLENRQLLPGISIALVQHYVHGMKSRFSTHPFINTAILRVSRPIHAEAKAIMYGVNVFNFANLTPETAPPVNFSTRIFPRGYPPFIRHITIIAKTLYGFRYLLQKGGYSQLKHFYRGLESLTLLLECENAHKGMAKKLSREPGEKWADYVKRLHRTLGKDVFGAKAGGVEPKLPSWIDLRLLFPGDSFLEGSEDEHQTMMLKQAVSEAFELLKRGQKSVEQACWQGPVFADAFK